MYNNIIHPMSESTNDYRLTNPNFDPNVGITADNNVWYNSNQATPDWAGSNAINTSPDFVDKDNGDFHLRPDNLNPIHNSGRQIALTTKDMNGFSLPQCSGHSIGAYEVLEGSPSSVPLPPAVLTAE